MKEERLTQILMGYFLNLDKYLPSLNLKEKLITQNIRKMAKNRVFKLFTALSLFGYLLFVIGI